MCWLFLWSAGIARDRSPLSRLKVKQKLLDRQKSPRENFWFYFSAAGLGLAFAAGLAADLAGACKDARSARVLTRLAAWDRLRVFLRALVFGMESSSPHLFRIEKALSTWLHPTL